MLTAAVTSPALTATGVLAGVETEAAVADKVPVVAVVKAAVIARKVEAVAEKVVVGAKAQKVAAVTVAKAINSEPLAISRGATTSL